MEKDKKAKTPRALGKAAAEHGGGEILPPSAKRSKGGKEESVSPDSGDESYEEDSAVHRKLLRQNNKLMEALWEKVASLENEVMAAKEQRETEQGRWPGNEW